MYRCIYKCPFYEHREKLFVRCEGGRFVFRDGAATSDYVAKYCCDEWKKCSVANALLQTYEREEQEDDEARRNQGS